MTCLPAPSQGRLLEHLHPVELDMGEAHSLEPDDLALNPESTFYQLCDIGQVTEPL